MDFLKILKYFEEPLIFVGSKYLTEEKRKLVENPEWENLDYSEDEPLE